jgi:hypothetical protein
MLRGGAPEEEQYRSATIADLLVRWESQLLLAITPLWLSSRNRGRTPGPFRDPTALELLRS